MSNAPLNGTASVVLVHSSDLHVDDTPGPGRYSGLLGLRSVLFTAGELGADFVLLAGDTFDNGRIAGSILAQATSLLAASPVPVIMLPGNHDPAPPDSIFHRAGLLDLPNVHILGLTHSETVRFDEHALEIHGRAHRGFADMQPVPEPRGRAARWQVVMAHGHYVPPCEWQAQSHRAWRISDDALAAVDADYIALGHWDRATQVGDGSVPAYYSGAPDLAGTVNVIRLAETGVHVERSALRWP